MYMASDDQVMSREHLLRLRQVARINKMIQSNGHQPQQTSLLIREQEETDTM
jgi:hypothetical protein